MNNYAGKKGRKARLVITAHVQVPSTRADSPSLQLLLYALVNGAQELHIAHTSRCLVLNQQVEEVGLVGVALAGDAQPQEGAAVDAHLRGEG